MMVALVLSASVATTHTSTGGRATDAFALLATVSGPAGAGPVPASAIRGAQEADPQRALLGKMTGHWVLRGTIGRKKTTHDVYARWLLNKEYVEIHETSREKDKHGKPQYEAIVLVVWDPKVGEFACQWLDTTGYGVFAAEGVGHAKPAGNTIPFVFKDESGGIHTTFAYDEVKGSWWWTIDNDDHGKLSPFARVTLTRR